MQSERRPDRTGPLRYGERENGLEKTGTERALDSRHRAETILRGQQAGASVVFGGLTAAQLRLDCCRIIIPDVVTKQNLIECDKRRLGEPI